MRDGHVLFLRWQNILSEFVAFDKIRLPSRISKYGEIFAIVRSIRGYQHPLYIGGSSIRGWSDKKPDFSLAVFDNHGLFLTTITWYFP
jgi:hypothetical protein